MRQSLRRLTPEQRRQILASLPDETARALLYDWTLAATDKQLPPSWAWVIWFVCAGRGFGKTRTGAEWLRNRVEAGNARRIVIAGPTAGDVRDVMVEGESGILAVSPPWCRPKYEPSKSRLTWPNGAVAKCVSADKPDRFRGTNCDTFWADELASWRFPDAWAQLQFGFRLGDPRGIVTSTPRPIALVKDLLAREGVDVAVTRGSTYENRSHLAPAFFDSIVRAYEGTRLGRQELDAELLDDNPGALWQRARLDALRVSKAPELKRIVVAIDPAVSSNPKSNETGIVVAGLGVDGHGYVLDDLSGVYTPAQWAARAVKAFDDWQADKVIGETNNGGDLVEANVRTARADIPYEGVHASRGKRARCEPVAALDEQGRVHHVGCLPRLEDQMCAWDPTNDDDSPDRIDARTWGLSFLMLNRQPAPFAVEHHQSSRRRA